MNKKIYTIIGVTALGLAGAYFLSFDKIYQPREQSQLAPVTKTLGGHERSIKAMEGINELRVNEITGDIDYAAYKAAEEATRKAQLRRVGKDLEWEELGPDDVGGRTRTIIIDKDDNTIMYAGAVSGGIWKSTTSGTSWKNVDDDIANINVSSGTQAANGDIYFGTGESGFVPNGAATKNGSPSFGGGGVFKSTDGITFTRLASTNNSAWTVVNKMAADPTDGNRIYAALGGGFYYSDDAGTSWTRTNAGNYRDIQVTSSGIVYTFSGSRIWKSTDKGATLVLTGFNIPANSPILSVGRATIAISPQDENYIYALVSNGNGVGSSFFEGLVRSTDAGANWELLVAGGPTTTEIMGTNGQGTYNNIISVDPLNKNRVFMGGVTLAEWDNVRGFAFIGSNFATRVNPSYVHSDKHEMVWDRTVTPPVLWIGTDGGIFRSANMYTEQYRYIFSEQNRGYITTQFYGLAAGEDGTVMGGTQDNSTLLINGNGNTPKSSITLLGGDGFQSEISRTKPFILFAESQNGAMSRSINGGVSFAPIWDDRIGDGNLSIPSPQSNFAPFDCQFRLWEDEVDSSRSRLFMAPYGKIWMALNVLDATNRPVWYNISNNSSSAGSNRRVVNIEASQDGGNLFYSLSNGGLFRVDSINDATFDTASAKFDIPAKITTTNIKGNISAGRVVTSIAIDPSNPNRALVTLGNYNNTAYVYVTNNVLDPSPTWTNVTGNLPRMPVFHGIILIDNPNYFVVATERGVWASDDNGATWELQDIGMPANVPSYIIRQYEFKPWEGPVVYVASHGRGFFKSKTFLTNVEKPTAQLNTLEVNAYPNPATDYLNVEFKAETSGQVSMVLYNLNGKQVRKVIEDVTKGQVTKTINTNGLPKGAYILSVGSGNNKKALKVLVN